MMHDWFYTTATIVILFIACMEAATIGFLYFWTQVSSLPSTELSITINPSHSFSSSFIHVGIMSHSLRQLSLEEIQVQAEQASLEAEGLPGELLHDCKWCAATTSSMT